MDATARNGDTVARATPSAQDGIPSITNTICLWATFDDNGTHSSQICNSNPSNPGLLSASTYRNGANLWPLPATNVTVTTDHPSGRCLAGEQTGYVPGGNGSTAPGSVCTSWTWGVPSTLPATVALNPGSTTRLPVMWTASENGQGAPAAGWPNSNSTNLWAHPRAMPGCAETGTCSTVTTAPELTWCPQGFCRTGRNDLPVLISPTGPVVRAVGDARPIEASALDRAGNGMYVYQMPSGSGSAVVPNGTLTANGSSVSSGELIGSTSTSDLSRFSYVYNRPVGYNNAVDVRVRLCPAPSGTPGTCANGATRTITITAARLTVSSLLMTLPVFKVAALL